MVPTVVTCKIKLKLK